MRETCENPAKEMRITTGGNSVPEPSAVSKRTESSRWQKFGIPLGRRQTAESTASTRPLRTAVQEIPQSQQ